MKKVACLLADGFEEIEGLTVVDMCRRAGIDIKTASISDSLEVTSSNGITVKADCKFDDIKFDEMDMIVLPGGGLGTENLEKFAPLKDVLLSFNEKGKFISAICAAPRILGDLGLLKGKKAICFPGLEGRLTGATIMSNEKCVTDGHIVTARGMGASVEFAAAIITQLLGAEKAEEIERQVQFLI
ncbi:MAG: DJ-1/PfpI family protein [Lachnospiraceae bacterium]|nr:DJ-1/PfpI family protein [Lachnospiraceae bacterium]